MENKKPAVESIPWTREEINDLREKVREHYYMFDKAAQILRFNWTRNDPRNPVASVVCSRAANGAYLPTALEIDKDSWDLMSQADRDFVVFHEMMHLFLNHISRAPLKPPATHRWIGKKYWNQIVNVAQDIAINEMLMEMLFTEEKQAFKTITALNLETGKREPWPPCTVRSVFEGLKVPESQWPSKSESSDTYVTELLKYIKKPDNDNQKQKPQKGNGESGTGQEDYEHVTPEEFAEMFPDFHPENAELSEEQQQSLDASLSKDDFPDRTKERIKKELGGDKKGEEEKESKKGKKAGDEKGGHWLLVKLTKPDPKPRWENVIKRWSERAEKLLVEETWLTKRDRYGSLMGRFALPTYEVDPYAESKNRAIVAFYADTSGSCMEYVARFVKAARSLDPKKFDARLYSFDTQVYDWDGSSKIQGGGGTDFGVVLKHAESLGRIDGVFMITDGYGTSVVPKEPKIWNVFLTDQSAHKGAFPASVKQYQLKDFE